VVTAALFRILDMDGDLCLLEEQLLYLEVDLPKRIPCYLVELMLLVLHLLLKNFNMDCDAFMPTSAFVIIDKSKHSSPFHHVSFKLPTKALLLFSSI